MQHKQINAIFILIFSFSFVVTGQKLVNSPYSRFNLGSLEPAASFRSLGMGGVGVAIRGNSSLYFSNPASYSSLDTNSFVFDIGLDYSMNFISDDVSDFYSDDLNFDHLIMGFPLTKGWGIALGVVPISSGYYKMTESVLKNDPAYDPLVGPYTSDHIGEGGFNNYFLGTGIKITKNLSAGINMTILLGQVTRSYQVNFADFSNTYQNNAIEKLHLSGVNIDYGLQYTKSLKNDYFLNAGISFGLGKNYSSNYERLAYRFTAYNTRDTITYISDDSTKAYIPGTIRLGISFGKKNKFTAGFDFISTKWSESRIPGVFGSVADTRSVHLGAEFIPDKYSNYSLLKRIEYRVGGHIGDNYLIIHGQQIKEYGASFGVGIPMRRTFSRTNFFFDYTKKTGTQGSLFHVENYYTMGISLNLYDFWFVKRKYD